MTGFEPWTSGIGSDRSTNWATTTSGPLRFLPIVVELGGDIFDRPQLVVPVIVDRDEEVPGEQGADSEPVEDDVDELLAILGTGVDRFRLVLRRVVVVGHFDDRIIRFFLRPSWRVKIVRISDPTEGYLTAWPVEKVFKCLSKMPQNRFHK